MRMSYSNNNNYYYYYIIIIRIFVTITIVSLVKTIAGRLVSMLENSFYSLSVQK